MAALFPMLGEGDRGLSGLLYVVAVIVLSIIGYAGDAIKKAAERRKDEGRPRSRSDEPISPIEPEEQVRPPRPVARPMTPPVARGDAPRPAPPIQRPLPAGMERPRPPVRPPQPPTRPARPAQPQASPTLRERMAGAPRGPARPTTPVARQPVTPQPVPVAGTASPSQAPPVLADLTAPRRAPASGEALSAKSFRSLSGAELRRAIVLNEVLSPPLALRDEAI